MPVRLPKNTENWTGVHAERCVEDAWREFFRYEAKVNFEWPEDKINDLYRPYQLARELAVQVARHANWAVGDAESLP